MVLTTPDEFNWPLFSRSFSEPEADSKHLDVKLLMYVWS
jgi:hypothetical protein